MNSTFNIQHSTFNAQCVSIGKHGRLSVGCWMLVVFRLTLFACLGGGFAAHLSASEPSLLPADGPPSGLIAAVPAAAAGAPADAVVPAAPRQRAFTENDLLALLTATLQKESV